MNKLAFPLVAMIMLLTAGCASSELLTGGSYTDEAAASAATVEVNSSTNDSVSETSGVLPEIAAYDEAEIPVLDTSANDSDSASDDSPEITALPDIEAYDDPEIPAIDAPETE
jgi:hypothetical protein